MLVPKLASGLCAFGQVISDVRYNYMAATPMRLDGSAELSSIEARFQALEILSAEGTPPERVAFRRSIDMRYVGQVHECTVDIDALTVDEANLPAICQRFHQLHKQLFTYNEPDGLLEIINIECTAIGKTAALMPPRLAGGKRVADAVKERRAMTFRADEAPVVTLIHDGTKLGADNVIDGPAVVEEPTTTIVVQPGWSLRLDSSATYVLTRKAA